MSDIIKPSPEQTSEQPIVDEGELRDQQTPHSGKGGYEFPVREFDKTPLTDAVNQDLISIPDHPGPLTEQIASPRKNRLALKIGAAVAVPVVAAAAFFIGKGSSDNPNPDRVVAESPVDSEEPEAPETPTGGETPARPEPSTPNSTPSTQLPESESLPDHEKPWSKNKYGGNINLLAVPLDEEPIVAVRPNGEEIRVSPIKGETPNQLANSVLALWGCYMSTGSEECLATLTSSTSSDEILKDMRDVYAKDVKPFLYGANGEDTYFAIVDNPKNPAEFSFVEDELGRTVIELSSGELYMNLANNSNFGSTEWQHQDIYENGMLASRAYSIRFYLVRNVNGQLSLDGRTIDIRPTEG